MLARIDGVAVVPDPPQVATLHVFVRAELERVNEALFAIAEERRTLAAPLFVPTPLPNVQRTEIGIGLPSLDVPTEEIAELYAEPVNRAAGAVPRRTAQAASKRAPAKPGGRRPPTKRR